MLTTTDKALRTISSETWIYNRLLYLSQIPYYADLLQKRLGMEEPPRSQAVANLSAHYVDEALNDLNVEPEQVPSKEPKRKKIEPMSKYWVFTEFIDDFETSTECFLQQLTDEHKLQYCVYQREICPTTNREHFQGYIECAVRKRLTWLKRNVSYTAHFERMRGTRRQARDYCMKKETRKPDCEPVELGIWNAPQPGKRTDLDAVKEKLDSGLTLAEIAVQDDTFAPCVRNFKGLEWYMKVTQLKGKPRTGDEPIEVLVYFGKPGSGKTWLAKQSYPDAFWMPSQSKWWDGYQGESTVIFDEFNHGWFPWDTFMRIIDRYPMKVEYKGGVIDLCARRFVLTTNTHPRLWYKNMGDKFAALARRIHKVLVFDKETTGVFEEMSLLEVPLPMNFSLTDNGVLQKGIQYND